MIAAFGVAAVLTAPSAGDAQPTTVPFSSGTLTGDWGGLRTRLSDHGVDLTAGYVFEVANNPRGGTREATRYSDQYAFGAKIDLQKLTGAVGGFFTLAITDRNGRDLTQDVQLQTLQQVQEVYGRGQTWRLTEFNYTRKWFGDAVDLKLGRIPVGDDFAAFTCDFQNLTFCGSQPGNLRGELWFNYPVSQWAARLKLMLNRQTYLQLGVYQVNPTYVDDSWARHHGVLPNNPGGTVGALIPLELGWAPPTALPGLYKFGVWLGTQRAADVAENADHKPLALNGGPPARHHPYGAYVNFLQRISGAAKGPGTDLFLNVSQTDRNTAGSTDRQIVVGMEIHGPFAGHRDDSIGLSIGTTHVNSRVAQDHRLRNAQTGGRLPIASNEYASELFYGWSPRKWAVLRPNIQYIVHPGGVSSRASVLIVGLKTVVDF